MPEPLFIYKLTVSQRLAVLSILIEHWQRCDNVTENFIDCSVSPPGVIEYGDLLELFSSTPELEREREVHDNGSKSLDSETDGSSQRKTA